MIKSSVQYYDVEINKDKNRLLAKLKGDWPSDVIAQNLRLEVLKQVENLTPGFSAIIDLSEFRLPSVTSLDYIKQIQRICINSGMGFQAEIISKSDYTTLGIERAKLRSGIDTNKRQKFHSLNDAEKWLDSQL